MINIQSDAPDTSRSNLVATTRQGLARNFLFCFLELPCKEYLVYRETRSVAWSHRLNDSNIGNVMQFA